MRDGELVVYLLKATSIFLCQRTLTWSNLLKSSVALCSMTAVNLFVHCRIASAVGSLSRTRAEIRWPLFRQLPFAGQCRAGQRQVRARYELDTSSKRKRESHLRQNSLARASCLYLLTFRMNLALYS